MLVYKFKKIDGEIKELIAVKSKTNGNKKCNSEVVNIRLKILLNSYNMPIIFVLITLLK